MGNSGIRTRHLRLPNRGDTRHLYYTKHQRICRLVDSARHGQFQEKEKTPTTELNIFLSKKIFRRKKVDANLHIG